MTVKEMHIKFRILLDRIEANYYKNILREEIDMFLNDAQDMFIKQRYGGNNVKRTAFEETQKRIDDLRTIVIPNSSLVKSVDQTGVSPDGIFYDLPSNYMFALQEEAEISYTDCNGNQTSERLGFVGTSLNEYNTIKDDPFAIPDPSKASDTFGLRLLFSKLEALTFGKFDITNYYLTYLRIPDVITYGGDGVLVASGSLEVGKQYKVVSGSITHNGVVLTVGQVFIAQNPNFTGVGTVTLNSIDCCLPLNAHIEVVNIAVNIALEAIGNIARFQSNSTLLQNQE